LISILDSCASWIIIQKKRLIIKLTESLETKNDSSFDLRSIYGAWDDSKNSDEIIKNIRDAKIDNRDIESFE